MVNLRKAAASLVSFFLMLVKIKIGIVDDMNNLIVLVHSILIERKLKGT